MRIINMDINKILKLHKKGLTNRAMAKELNCHHNTISYNLKKLGLKSNWDKNQPIKLVGDNKAQCSKCGAIRNVKEFQYGRKGQKYEYKFSYCNKCRKAQSYLNLNKNIEAFLSDRFNRLKVRAKKLNIKFDITKDFLINLYKEQKGKCFYTGYKMEWGVGGGRRRNALSIDKIVPSLGYIKNNVVLCCNFINSVKFDLTLEEIKLWLPLFYKKINKKLLTERW